MSDAYVDDPRRITYFASTHTRGKREMFGIRAEDRGKHIYVIGKTGMGKSTMLENMAIQDIQNGEGIAFVDPHGSTAEKLLDFVPHDRINDVLYFAPFDIDNPVGFNVMEDVGYDKRHLVVSGLMGAFKRIWVDAWSARMEYILSNTMLALLEYPGATLLDVNRMLTNKNFRAAVIEKITDPIVKEFWTVEFATYTDRYTQEATPAIQNKIGAFTSNPLVRNIVGQPESTFDIRKMMDERKILIVNLSKGRMGEQNAALIGSMLVVKIYLAAMSRADEPASRMAKLPRFYFYVDEFQSMMNDAFADILSESRKYKLALTLANQYIEQMEEKVRDAVFGNVGTLITFRVGPFDAETLKTVFEPTFFAEDLVELGLGQIYLTLMIDGVGSTPFSAQTVPPIDPPHISYRNDVVTESRAKYGKTRVEIEKGIVDRQLEYAPPPPQKKSFGPPSSSNNSGGGNWPQRNPASAPRDDRPREQRTAERPAFQQPRNDRPPFQPRDTAPRVHVPEKRPERPIPIQVVDEVVQKPSTPVGAPTAPVAPPQPQRHEQKAPEQPREIIPQPTQIKEQPRPLQQSFDEERAKLRDALKSVQTHSAPVKSPAEIMREKMKGKVREQNIQEGNDTHKEYRMAPPPPSHRTPDRPPPAEQRPQYEEIPNELLRKMLAGE